MKTKDEKEWDSVKTEDEKEFHSGALRLLPALLRTDVWRTFTVGPVGSGFSGQYRRV